MNITHCKTVDTWFFFCIYIQQLFFITCPSCWVVLAFACRVLTYYSRKKKVRTGVGRVEWLWNEGNTPERERRVPAGVKKVIRCCSSTGACLVSIHSRAVNLYRETYNSLALKLQKCASALQPNLIILAQISFEFIEGVDGFTKLSFDDFRPLGISTGDLAFKRFWGS